MHPQHEAGEGERRAGSDGDQPDRVLPRLTAEPHGDSSEDHRDAGNVQRGDPRHAPVCAWCGSVDDTRRPGDVRRPVQPAPAT